MNRSRRQEACLAFKEKHPLLPSDSHHIYDHSTDTIHECLSNKKQEPAFANFQPGTDMLMLVILKPKNENTRRQLLEFL